MEEKEEEKGQQSIPTINKEKFIDVTMTLCKVIPQV
jgi:hypothetical protein